MKYRGMFLSTSLLVAACGTLPQGPSLATQSDDCSGPPTLFSISAGPGGSSIGTTSLSNDAHIEPPLNADGTRVFHLTSTIPVKIRVTDCEGNRVNSLAPTFTMAQIDGSGTVLAEVQVIRSSSEADEGSTLRHAGNGQYLFNLSTKLSGLLVEGDLPAGRYRLTISSPADFADVVVEFTLR